MRAARAYDRRRLSVGEPAAGPIEGVAIIVTLR